MPSSEKENSPEISDIERKEKNEGSELRASQPEFTAYYVEMAREVSAMPNEVYGNFPHETSQSEVIDFELPPNSEYFELQPRSYYPPAIEGPSTSNFMYQTQQYFTEPYRK